MSPPSDGEELQLDNEEHSHNEARSEVAIGESSSEVTPASPSPSPSDEHQLNVHAPPTHHDLRMEHWRASPWAVGCVDPTWGDTVQSAKRRRRERRAGAGHRDTRTSRQAEFETYLCIGAWFCNVLDARRVGNMAVLARDSDVDGEDKNMRLKCVAGPYWPVNVCIVWPAIIALSIAVVVLGLSDEHPGIIVAWAVLTLALMVSMVRVSFRDPGILRRHAEKPGGEAGEQWIWNDQALTYRPRKARYDTECACVIEDHDHVCPWTGTAIGRGNMCAFRCFVGLIFAVIIVDIIIIVARVVPR